MYDEGSNYLVRSQPSFLKLTKRRRRRRRKSDVLKKNRQAVKDKDVLSGHVKHQGRKQTGRPSGLMHQTQLSIMHGFHYHGNISVKGHLGASRSPAAFLQKSHPQVTDKITDKMLKFGKLYFPAWVWKSWHYFLRPLGGRAEWKSAQTTKWPQNKGLIMWVENLIKAINRQSQLIIGPLKTINPRMN